jgi:hypothetical protein
VELHLKISPAVEPLGKLPRTPSDSCDLRVIGPLAGLFRCFPVVAWPGDQIASDFVHTVTMPWWHEEKIQVDSLGGNQPCTS